MRTYVYKLRPTRDQEAKLATTLETCRLLYNRALAERKEAWEQERRSVTFAAQCAALPAQKRENSYLPAVHSQVLQNVVRRLDRSFENYFRRVKVGERAGYPRFKGRGWYDSFCYPQWDHGATLRDGRLVLSKIGTFRIVADRPIAGKPKTCTIARKADGWYAHITCESVNAALPATGASVGVDVGITHFATLSTGETIANPRHYRAAERRLRKAQRRVSRRTKGSKRRAKARSLLAKAHLHVRRQRRDFAHKTALMLVRRFDRIAVEDLNIGAMLKNHALAKHIQDAGWGQFRRILSDKAASAGRMVVAVSPAGTSQACSACGTPVPKKLSDRWHSCPHCGCELDRDLNAALNIEARGHRVRGADCVHSGVKPRTPYPLGLGVSDSLQRLSARAQPRRTRHHAAGG